MRGKNVTEKYHRNGRSTSGGRLLLTTRRTVSITVETSRLFVILRGTSARAWCEQCATEVDMVPIESAAELARVDRQTVQQLLAGKNIHRSQSAGPVQICLNSLLKEIE